MPSGMWQEQELRYTPVLVQSALVTARLRTPLCGCGGAAVAFGGAGMNLRSRTGIIHWLNAHSSALPSHVVVRVRRREHRVSGIA